MSDNLIDRLNGRYGTDNLDDLIATLEADNQRLRAQLDSLRVRVRPEGEMMRGVWAAPAGTATHELEKTMSDNRQETTMSDYTIGDRIRHDTTAEYLGTIREIGKVTVRFDGPRSPKDLATFHEIEIETRPPSGTHMTLVPLDPPGKQRRWKCKGCGQTADGINALNAVECHAPMPEVSGVELGRNGDEPMTDDLTEQLCEEMHDRYEKAAAGAGWETNPASRKPWADVPEANKATMRAAIGPIAERIDKLEALNEWMQEQLAVAFCSCYEERADGLILHADPCPLATIGTNNE